MAALQQQVQQQRAALEAEVVVLVGPSWGQQLMHISGCVVMIESGWAATRLAAVTGGCVPHSDGYQAGGAAECDSSW